MGNQIYYHHILNKNTGLYNLRFRSKISNRDLKILCKKLEIPLIKPIEKEIEESQFEEEIEELKTKFPPCIRAILIESEMPELLGTLFLIPYTGGSIGNNFSSNLINFKDQEDIEKEHAFIEYDINKKFYYING
jgi:hypothetical protein